MAPLDSTMPRKFTHYSILIAILWLAFALRIVAIDTVPLGLSHDETYSGLMATQVLDGDHRIFFDVNNGLEPLFIYMKAISFYGLGLGPVQMRLVSVMWGFLTLPLIYVFVKRILNRHIATFTMFGIAISFWAIFVSRLALRAVVFPPLLILALYLFWRALTHSNRRYVLLFSALSGLVAGISLYTYLSSRFLPFIVIAVFAIHWLFGRLEKIHWAGIFLYFVALFLIFAPLATYYLNNIDSFSRRSSQVSTIPYLMNGEFGPTFESTILTLGMLTIQGDKTDRYNLDGRPIFDWGNGLLFYLGIGLCLYWLWRSSKHRLVALWLFIWTFVMLVPDFITDDSPHFLRTIGALPPVYIFWAIGLNQGVEWLRDGLSKFSLLQNQLKYIPMIVILLLFTGSTLHTSYDYFGRWSQALEARHIYGADIAEIAQGVQSDTSDFPVISSEYYLDLDQFRLDFHSKGDAPFAIWFDGQQSLAFPPPQSGLDPSYFFAASAPLTPAWEPFLVETTDKFNDGYTLYTLPDEASLLQTWAETFPPENQLAVNVNDDLLVRGHRLLGNVVSGGKFQILLGWQALQTLAPDTDYTFLVQLQDNQGHTWAVADGNGYPPGTWQQGVLGLQLLQLRLPEDLPLRTYNLSLQIVNRQSGAALPTDTGDSSIFLQTVASQLKDAPDPIDVKRLPNPTELRGSSSPVALRGFDVSERRLSVGETTKVTLHWQILEKPEHDYQLKFSLWDNIAVSDSILYEWPEINPIGGEWLTSQWPKDYWVQDRVDLELPPNIASGEYYLRIQWVNTEVEPASFDFFDLEKIIVE